MEYLKVYILVNLNLLEENYYFNVTSLKTIYIDLRKTVFLIHLGSVVQIYGKSSYQLLWTRKFMEQQ